MRCSATDKKRVEFLFHKYIASGRVDLQRARQRIRKEKQSLDKHHRPGSKMRRKYEKELRDDLAEITRLGKACRR